MGRSRSVQPGPVAGKTEIYSFSVMPASVLANIIVDAGGSSRIWLCSPRYRLYFEPAGNGSVALIGHSMRTLRF